MPAGCLRIAQHPASGAQPPGTVLPPSRCGEPHRVRSTESERSVATLPAGIQPGDGDLTGANDTPPPDPSPSEPC